jgi:GntR family transcriptional regulator
MASDSYKIVDKKNKIPYYLQVRDQLMVAIREQRLKPGDKLPNEHQLSEMFDVSRPTIRQAIKDLEIEDLIVRYKGRGTFVSEKKVDTTLMQSFGIHDEELGKINVDFHVKVLTRKITKPSIEIAKILQIEKNEDINYFEKIRITGNKPLSFTISYIPVKLCPGIINEDLENHPSPDLIENKYRIHISKVKRYLVPVNVNYSKRIAKLLKVRGYEPFFYLQTFYYSEDGIPISYYRGFYSKERSRFTFYLER